MPDKDETLLLRLLQDVIDGGGVVADGRFVPPEVPELAAGGAVLRVVAGRGCSSAKYRILDVKKQAKGQCYEFD
jgi:hypothetical protein